LGGQAVTPPARLNQIGKQGLRAKIFCGWMGADILTV
jgi:hypothetical protein